MNIHPETQNEAAAPQEPYSAPHLTIHGKLERLTLDSSGSLGTGSPPDTGGGIPMDPGGLTGNGG